MNDNKKMLTFTEKAKQHILTLLQDKNNTPAGKSNHRAVFRLSIKQTGCTGWMYMPTIVDSPDDNDVLVYQDEFNAYVAETAIDAVKGTEVDYQAKSFQRQMVFNNPNADSMCGCGESFNLKKHESNN